MTLGSLFDGSGGFPLAGIVNGVEPVWASEIEPYPLRVTAKRFPAMKQLGDVTKINGAEIEPVVHGRWIYGITLNHEWRKCSECLVSQDIFGCFTYCPNCGAKMDGGNDDENA